MGKRDKDELAAPTMRGLDLQAGEEVVVIARPSRLAVWPKYVFTLGLYGIWRKRHTSIVTDRRILLGKGIVSRSERSIPFNHVDEASFRRRGTYAYCDVIYTTRGQRNVQRVGPLSARAARRFAREVQART